MSTRDSKLEGCLSRLLEEARDAERSVPGAAFRKQREIDELHEYVTALKRDNEQLRERVVHATRELATAKRENEQLAQERQRWCDRYNELRERVENTA